MADAVPAAAGLCASCCWAEAVRSGRGSTFVLCGRFRDDPRFAKYPRLPIVACVGYDPGPPSDR
ncbi:MAG: hypothetical protein WEC75_02565 [Dehalococcoidia bacterium]